MRPLHVVALAERLDDDFPVRGEHRAEVGAEAQLLEVVRREQRREWIEELEQRRCFAIEAHEHEPAPGVDAHGREG